VNVAPGIVSFHVLTLFRSSRYQGEQTTLLWAASSSRDESSSSSSLAQAKNHESHHLVDRLGKGQVDVYNVTDVLQAVFGDDQQEAVRYMLTGAVSGEIKNVADDKAELAGLILETIAAVEDRCIEPQKKIDRANCISENSDETHSSNAERRLDVFVEFRFDGGSRGNPGLGGAGVELYYAWQINNNTAGRKKVLIQHFPGDEPVTCNQAEYQGVIRGLEEVERIVQDCQELCNIGARNCHLNLFIQGDSKLVVNQLKGEYRCKSERLIPLFSSAESLIQHLERSTSVCDLTIEHIRRNYNSAADGTYWSLKKYFVWQCVLLTVGLGNEYSSGKRSYGQPTKPCF
jgi:ribonuclease HI